MTAARKYRLVVYPSRAVLQRGATLLEIVTTVALVAVIATMAVPSFQAFVAQNRVTTVSNDLARDLSFARTQAVARGQLVMLCTSTDKNSCSDSSWQGGWIVWVDLNGNAEPDAESEPLLRVTGSIPTTTATLSASGFGGAKQLGFRPTGESTVGGGQFTVCSPDGRFGRRLNVGPTGLVQIETTSCV